MARTALQKITVYDGSLAMVTQLFTWVSLIWNECWADAGEMLLELIPEQSLLPLLQPGCYLRYSESESLMLLETVQLTRDSLVLRGHDAVQLLDTRCCPVGTEAGAAETVMTGLVTDYCGDLPNLLVEVAGIGASCSCSAVSGGSSVLELLKTIALETGLGFRLRKEGTALVFRCCAPAEGVQARFSSRYRNLDELTWTRSCRDYRNVAVVAGEDSGGSAITVTVGDTDASGTDRRELFVDASGLHRSTGETEAAYRQRLEQRGREALADHARLENLELELIAGTAAVGDLVTAQLPEYGLTVTTVITAIQLQNQDGVTRRTATVGTDIL